MKVIEQFNKIKEKINFKIQKGFAYAIRWCKRIGIAIVLAVAIAATGSVVTISWAIPHVHNIYSAAKLIDGEARGESLLGQRAVFSTLLVRRDHQQFPDTMHGVAYQPYTNNRNLLQYNAMGDHLHENLATEVGQLILWRTMVWYVQDRLGVFVAPQGAQGAHSYCTPEACERQSAYFGRLRQIGQIGNHVFFGDTAVAETVVAQQGPLAPTRVLRPVMRPVHTESETSAPTRSLRPVLRPVDLHEQSIEMVIADILASE